MYKFSDEYREIKLNILTLNNTVWGTHGRLLNVCDPDEPDDYRIRAEIYERRRYTQSGEPFHPVVWQALELARPVNWHLLVLECSWYSTTDRTRIAYTRDYRGWLQARAHRNGEGGNDGRIVTTYGKYLTRHFPTLSSTQIRDLCALYTDSGACKLVYTMAEMIHHLMKGPHSCMRSDGGNFSSDGHHPYEVYDPAFGWHMAVRIVGGETVGRALCYTVPDSEKDYKYFVRTYRKPDAGESAYSQRDDNMEAWLKSQGYQHDGDWEGAKLKAINIRDDIYVAPYLDGGAQKACLARNEKDGLHFVVDSQGEYDMSNTSGRTEEEGDCTCEDCGDHFDDGDGYWVGYHEDSHVCSSCCDHNYVYAYTRGGRQRYLNSNDTSFTEYGGDWYHDEYLGDNEMVMLHDGELAYEGDAVYIESQGEYYRSDDDDVCYTEDTAEYMLKEDCWMCTESGNWYEDTDFQVEVDGELYHANHAPETEETESTEGN